MRSVHAQSLDDRGAAVSYRDPMFHGSELDPDERARVNRRKGSGVPVWAIGAIAAALVMQVPRLAASPLSTILSTLALMGGFTIAVWFFIIPPVRRALWSRRWKARYKQLGRCPACQYALATLDPAPDGCTVCPECGGAWRLSK